MQKKFTKLLDGRSHFLQTAKSSSAKLLTLIALTSIGLSTTLQSPADWISKFIVPAQTEETSGNAERPDYLLTAAETLLKKSKASMVHCIFYGFSSSF